MEMAWRRQLWARLKVVATAHLEAQAKQKAKQALEIADAVAQEERVALQQYQLSLPQQPSVAACCSMCPSDLANSFHAMPRLAAADLI